MLSKGEDLATPDAPGWPKMIETRRAVKAFDPNHRMTEAEIERLLSLALKAPTAFNIQNWRFVLVRDLRTTPGTTQGFLEPGAGDGRLARWSCCAPISSRGRRASALLA